MSNDLTIKLEGTNTISSSATPYYNTYYGIEINGGILTITGDGSLTLNAGKALVYNYGILASKIYMTSGTVVVNGGELTGTTQSSPKSYGVRATGGLQISGGSLTATGGTATAPAAAKTPLSCGISFGSGSLVISGTAQVTANGGASSAISCGVRADGTSSVSVSGGSLNAAGGSGGTGSYGIGNNNDQVTLSCT